MKFSAQILLGLIALSNTFAFLQHTEPQSSFQVSGNGEQSFKFGALEWLLRSKSHKSHKSHVSRTKKSPKPSLISHTSHSNKLLEPGFRPSYISHTSHSNKPPGPGFPLSYINHTNHANEPPEPALFPVHNRTAVIVVKRATCKLDCIHGDCVGPNQCQCYPGYYFNNDSLICRPYCSKGCQNGRCTGPDYCTCLQGYTPSANQRHVCEPVCRSGCNYGRCVEPNKCQCNEYFDEGKDAKGHSICVDACHNRCLNLVCRPHHRCYYCDYGWAGTHCEQPTVCSISFGNSSLAMLNLHVRYMESTDNETWLRPICDSSCINEITDKTICVGKLDNRPVKHVTCFIDINAACNAKGATIYSLTFNWTTLALILLFLIIIAIAVRIKKRSNSEDKGIPNDELQFPTD